MRLTLDEKDYKKSVPGKKEEIPSFMRSSRDFIIELVKIVVIAVVVIIPIRYFLFQPFYVKGASMEPAFHDNEYLIIDEITYRFNEPQRGEVIVIKDPKRKSEFLIKRIIGLPGEAVEIKNGRVLIYNAQHPTGIMLQEEYLSADIYTSGSGKTQLGFDQYFVLGDNRPVSLDSRNFGPINRKQIVGRAWLRVWPFDQWRHFTLPEYKLSG